MKTYSGTDVADTLATFCNGANSEDLAEFVQTLTKGTHRTLQQRAMGLFIMTLEAWAKDLAEARFDARNEATVKMAKKLVDAMGDKYDRVMPLI